MLPRKSPRQHASTLAILSSLIHQRKKRKSNDDSDTSRVSLPSIPEEEETLNETRLSEEEQLQQEQEQAELTKAIDDILSTPLDEQDITDHQETVLEDVERIEIKHNQDCIELIENFHKEDANFSPFTRRRGRRGRLPRALLFAKYVAISPMTPVNNNNSGGGTKSVRRKRKKNRTGWPKKKRLFTAKKAGHKEEEEVDGETGRETENVELDDSRLTEISMEEENGEVEMCELDHREQQQQQQHQQQPNDSVNSECIRRTMVDNSEEEQITSTESDKETEKLNENNQIQGVSKNLMERLNNVNNINNSKTNNVLAENLNNNSVSDKSTDECDDNKEPILNETKNGVIANSLLINKMTLSENVTNDVTAVPEHDDTKNHIAEKGHSTNTMIKVSVSTDFSSNKVPASPKKSDTVYSVTILDCKKSVVDGKKVDPCEEVGVKDNWETSERVVHYHQPLSMVGRVQKNENSAAAGALQNANRRLRSSSSPSPERKPKVKKAKIVPPTSPRSPRKLRAPRGKWYRER